MGKFKEFEIILKTMQEMNYDYEQSEPSTKITARKNGKKFTIQEHLSALIYSELSAQKTWKQIEDNREKINKIFRDFEPEYLKKAKAEKLEKEIRNIKCGNRQIHNQMLGIKDNILMLEKIEKEYGTIDNFVTSDDPLKIAKLLSKGKYKLNCVGLPLAMEYLKDVGVDCIKPDIHICRILARLGYTKGEKATKQEAIDIIQKIANEYNLYNMQVDTILWQYCTDGYLEICTSNPKCDKCKIKCKYSQLER